jgi:hypothetical protein
MKAEYLTIADQPIEKGATYWTVEKNYPFYMNKHKAHTENNVTYNCYFTDMAQAAMYQQAKRLSETVNAYVKSIEVKHLGK